jgi:hypothetical protein
VRIHLLARLRRRRQIIARVLLPLATVAWLGCGAAPCLAAVASSASGAGTHGHSPTQRPQPAEHGAAHHAVAHGAGHSTHGAPADSQGAPVDSPTGCPHCAAGNGHVAAQPDCADPAAAAAVKPRLELAPQIFALPAVWLPPPRTTRPHPRPPPPALEPIALNLRHCVFLI